MKTFDPSLKCQVTGTIKNQCRVCVNLYIYLDSDRTWQKIGFFYIWIRIRNTAGIRYVPTGTYFKNMPRTGLFIRILSYKLITGTGNKWNPKLLYYSTKKGPVGTITKKK
jgi:hypothetical protein